MPIKMLNARQIFDTTARPTVEVDLVSELGLFRVGVPSTDVARPHEALQLRDNITGAYGGLGVTTAVKNINTIIAPELIKQNLEVTQQKEIDNFMMVLDGTENKCRLGSNAMLAVSLVCAKAAAAKKGMPLYRHISDLAAVNTIIMPVPHFTIFMGGLLSSNGLPFQEYMIMPTGAASFADAMKMGTEIYLYIKNAIIAKYGMDAAYVSDTGGFSPPFETHREACVFIHEGIKQCGYQGRVELSFNCAATDLYKDGAYDVDIKNPAANPQDYLTSEKLGELYMEGIKEFQLASVEDPFFQDDWGAWASFTARAPASLQVVANDLTQTNLRRAGMSVEKKACTTVALRLNQAGTLTEVIDVFKLLKTNGVAVLLNDRWGDTDDLFMADMAVGLSCGQVRYGAPAHGERVGKYNQILRIEEELGPLAKYAGKNYRGEKDK